jgi:hypothetical protein
VEGLAAPGALPWSLGGGGDGKATTLIGGGVRFHGRGQRNLARRKGRSDTVGLEENKKRNGIQYVI